MNVSLTPQLDAFVRSKVETGRYTSSSEVIREALRLLEQFESVQQTRLVTLRAEVAQAVGQIEREETTVFDPDEIKREGRARLERQSSGATPNA